MTNPTHAKINLPYSLVLAAGQLIVGIILINVSNGMSNQLAAIEMPCKAQSLFMGSQSSQCFWGTNLLPLYNIVFVVALLFILGALTTGGIPLLTAYKLYSEVNKLDQEIAEDPHNPERYIKRANMWRLRKEYTKALADFAIALRIDSHNISAHYDRGLTYISQSAWEPALADYNIVLEQNPHKASAYNARGVVLDKLGEFKKALKDYEKAVALEPAVVLYKQNLAKLKAKIDIDKTNVDERKNS